MSVLSEILAEKRTHLERAKRTTSLSTLYRQVADAPPARDFVGAIERATPPALIAEVKQASPSKGLLREDYDPVSLARAYALNGAHCVSVLTEEAHFLGHLSHLTNVARSVPLPIMRKDFLFDEYQIVESRVAGADAVLLIVAALRPTELKSLLQIAHGLHMAAFVEVHNEDELAEAVESGARLIGINNRDLHVFRTDLKTTLTLAPMVPPDRLVISESGIRSREDMVMLRDAGVRGALVGESLMRAADVGAKVRELLGTTEPR
ncbi:MAG: indole-3-glycerol phosphate synthase TrpC [Chthonomonadales bacterium]|nr:indole-3-glycerol phosphate synthase TrpC [Chthonomonadales bacterium]